MMRRTDDNRLVKAAALTFRTVVALATGVFRPGRSPLARLRSNRVAPTLTAPWKEQLGTGDAWAPTSYGHYYARSAAVYSVIKIRQDAVARVPWQVYERGRAGRALPDHAAQRLLDRPNPFWTGGDLWRATEAYLGLWGSAFWGLERDESGRVAEIWPLRSDRMRVVPDADSYIRGFVYVGPAGRPIAYVPEDVVWMRYFNPLDEFAGMSPLASVRLSADMGIDALRASRNNLTNDSTPGVFIETGDAPGDLDVQEFYQRWEGRFQGVDKVRRPVLLHSGMRVSSLGFSPREMEYLQSLRWGLEEVARAYGVPKPMIGEIEKVTFSNFNTARRVFWEDTIVPQLTMFQDAMNRSLMPRLDPSVAVRYDLSRVEAMRDSEDELARRRRSYVAAGIMTVGEVRAEMGLPPLPRAGSTEIE